MSVVIINTTANQRNFENDFCTILRLMINTEIELINVSGENLLNNQLINSNGHEVVVIVSHADTNGEMDTELDCGFGWGLLDNPTILTQLLENNSKKFILIYCACRALSPETIVSGVEDPNCIGVIASRNSIQDIHITSVAQVINMAHDFVLENNEDINSLQMNIRKSLKQVNEFPDFYFFDVPRVFEED